MPILTKRQLIDFTEKSAEFLNNSRVTKKNIAGYAGTYPAPYGRRYTGIAPYLAPEKEYDDPSHVSFFYLKIEPNGVLNCRVYQDDNFSDLDGKIGSFIEDARRDNPTLPSQRDPNDVKWDRPTYVALFLDNPGWNLIDIPVPRDGDVFPSASLHFLEIEGYSIANSSFFDAENRGVDVQLDITGAKERVRYLCCRNLHLIPQTGDVRPAELKNRDNYKFDVFFSLDIEESESTLLLIIDPGGHNTGPDD